MLNHTHHSNAQRAQRTFYFNPEGQVGGGTIPTETNEPQTVPPPEDEPTDDSKTETPPAGKPN